jgi:hypothetical protein
VVSVPSGPTFFEIFLAAESRPAPRDPCRRSGGNERSRQAFEQLQRSGRLSPLRRAVLDVITAAGEKGATSSEICAALNKFPNVINGRILELVGAGLVYRCGVRRGCAICYRTTEGL